MKQYPAVVVDMYEHKSNIPIGTHIFFGETIEEARSHFKGYQKTDSVLRAAVNTGYVKGTRVKVGMSEVLGE